VNLNDYVYPLPRERDRRPCEPYLLVSPRKIPKTIVGVNIRKISPAEAPPEGCEGKRWMEGGELIQNGGMSDHQGREDWEYVEYGAGERSLLLTIVFVHGRYRLSDAFLRLVD
jgi:hypothetical protein